MTIWFTADFHLGHENIIKYCDRPFKNAAEMDKKIIANFNKVVAADDTVYILGDLAWDNRVGKYFFQISNCISFNIAYVCKP